MKYVLLAANIIMAIAFGVTYQKLPPQLPLFYSRSNGEAQLGTWWMIAVIPLCMNVLYVLNRFVGKKFFSDNRFVLNLVYYVNFMIIISFVLIFLKIIFLIT